MCEKSYHTHSHILRMEVCQATDFGVRTFLSVTLYYLTNRDSTEVVLASLARNPNAITQLTEKDWRLTCIYPAVFEHSSFAHRVLMAEVYINGQVNTHGLPPDDVIIGHSPQMAAARSKIELAAATDLPILLQGESGTGKEVVARLLHVRSLRARYPFVKVMCLAIPNTLVESELFGYEPGAFTGANSTKSGRVELAQNGTLFLDEIGGLDLSFQAKLLQLLQDGTFMRVGGQTTRSIKARIISSANVDLKARTEDGSFRLDLLYRLNAVTIDLPPVRRRIEDLPVLVDYFLDLYSRTFQRTPPPLSAHMMTLMRRFDWPGNIRQLENLVRSYVVIGDEEVFAAELTAEKACNPIPEIDLAKPVSLKGITKAATARLEQEIIHKVLKANGGSRRKTAQWLNISYRSLLYKLGECHLASYSFEQRSREPDLAVRS